MAKTKKLKKAQYGASVSDTTSNSDKKWWLSDLKSKLNEERKRTRSDYDKAIINRAKEKSMNKYLPYGTPVKPISPLPIHDFYTKKSGGSVKAKSSKKK